MHRNLPKDLLASFMQQSVEAIILNDDGHDGFVSVIRGKSNTSSGGRHILEVSRSATHINYQISHDVAMVLLGSISMFGRAQNVNVIMDYTSFNPTGTPHFGNLCNAIRGEILHRIKGIGCNTMSLYYLNDVGNQVTQMKGVLSGQAEGYPEISNLSDDLRRSGLRHVMMHFLRRTLALAGHLGIMVNKILAESCLGPRVMALLGDLARRGLLFRVSPHKFVIDFEGQMVCLWDFDWTYMCADLALQFMHLSDGFSRSILILGADHRHHAKMITKIFNTLFSPTGDFLEVILMSKVAIMDNGRLVKMSKRKGVDMDVQRRVAGSIGYWIGISTKIKVNNTCSSQTVRRLVEERVEWCVCWFRLHKLRFLGGDIGCSLLRHMLFFHDVLQRVESTKEINAMYTYMITLVKILNERVMLHPLEYLQSLRIFGVLNWLLGLDHVQEARIWDFHGGT